MKARIKPTSRPVTTTTTATATAASKHSDNPYHLNHMTLEIQNNRSQGIGTQTPFELNKLIQSAFFPSSIIALLRTTSRFESSFVVMSTTTNKMISTYQSTLRCLRLQTTRRAVGAMRFIVVILMTMVMSEEGQEKHTNTRLRCLRTAQDSRVCRT